MVKEYLSNTHMYIYIDLRSLGSGGKQPLHITIRGGTNMRHWAPVSNFAAKRVKVPRLEYKKRTSKKALRDISWVMRETWFAT